MTSPGSQQAPFAGGQDPMLMSPHQKMSPNSQMVPPQTPTTPGTPGGFPAKAGMNQMGMPGNQTAPRQGAPNFPMTSMAGNMTQQQGFNQEQMFQ